MILASDSGTNGQLLAALIGAIVPILVAVINSWTERMGQEKKPATNESPSPES